MVLINIHENKWMHCSTGTSIPMGHGGHVPQYLWRGDIHGNVPPNIIEVMSFMMSIRVAATVVCCILMQILCVVSQKKLQLLGGLHPPDPLPGLRPWTPLGNFRTPDLQSSFMSPPIILWDRRPCRSMMCIRILITPKSGLIFNCISPRISQKIFVQKLLADCREHTTDFGALRLII